MIFQEFVTKWRELVPTDYYKASTKANYESHIKRYLIPEFGAREFQELDTLVLQAYVSRLHKTGVSAKTVRNVTMTLRVLWKAARAWKVVSGNPFDGLMLPRVIIKERVSFAPEQVRAIIAAAPSPYNLFFWLAAETGMRAGELCGLRWDDVSCDEGLVHVRQSVWSGRVQMPKTKNSLRTCAISVELSDALRVHLVQETRRDSMRFVFTTVLGRPWNPSAIVDRRLHPILESLGLPRAGLHAFRHTAASLANHFGLDMKTQQQRLGHSDARLTLDVYTHARRDGAGDDEREFVAWLGKQFALDVPKTEAN